MLPLHQIASIVRHGGSTEVICRYCHLNLRADWQKGTGSGHAEDCDAILAGITVDQAKEDRKNYVATHTPLQVKFMDFFWSDWLKGLQEAYRNDKY